ncbi:iron-siderophore ABC transporter substrate-binding protein [Kitasatospora sp. GP82]|uniref:iron-siderophore ABC transporter substrate-binding protein n=1 Tax=Kitasatospora sp. GP82 TaxID=3035089 RepID=UPI002476AFEC|nr:iron-siderophore ABC transporter substrate-binding protein [Kitasatospora sp. GP82]MDH6126252.1 iron complex transport system substrate-binding protein [Kitasatospora sp. GP82]
MPRQPSRRTVLLGLAGLAALGAGALPGCTSTARGPATTATSSGLSPTPSPVGPDNEPPSPQPLPSTTVTAATGVVAVPGSPTRVVALDTAELDSAITLGITPLGAAQAPADHGLPDYWPASWLAGIATVGTIGDPDTAMIASLGPQLILGNQTRDGARYDALSRIAPTVLTQTTGYPWKTNFQLHAQALGRQEQAAAVVSAYGRHVSQTAQAIADAGSAGKRISIVRFVEGSPNVRLYGRQSFVGTLLADLQLGRPDPQNVDQFDIEVPPDQIAKADGDLLLYSIYGDPAKAGATAVLAGSGWQSLNAVKTHRAFSVDDQLWFEGIGYTGANLILAELQRFLGG